MEETESPEALLARWREHRRPGDLAALFDATAGDLYRLALHVVPDAATAEDVLQETFLAVMEGAEAYDPCRPAMPWLSGVLRNQAGMARRRLARRPDPRRTASPSSPDDPASLAETAEEREALHAAMQALPEPYRGVALLRWRYGLEPAEIADVRGVPPGTVWSLLHRAVKRLKAEVGALPAILLLFRPERGLDGVRRALLRRAAAEAAAGVATATTLGGFLMANKALAVAAAVLVIGTAGWLAFRTGGEPAPLPAAGPVVARVEPPPAASPALPAAAAPPAIPAGPVLPDPVDLEKCDRDLDLFGVVVDGKGGPVAGALVRTLTHPWREVAPLSAERRYEAKDGPTTVSARDGTFVLRLRRGQSVVLTVTHADFVPVQMTHRLAGERLRVVMAEGGRLEVTVKDPDGKPVAGARARVWRVVSVLAVVYEANGVSGADGRCIFAGLPAGRLTLSVEHDGFGVPAWQQPEVAPPDVKSVEVVLPRGRAVEGRVTDARTGKAIAGAKVGGNWTLTRAGTTDAEGRYRFHDWTGKGFNDLHVTAEGYGRQGKTVPPEGTLDFAMEPGDRIAGRVVGADGSPVAGARIGCVASQRTGGSQEIDAATAVSGSDGRFELKGLRHDLPHLLLFMAPGHGRGVFDVLPPAESPGSVDLGDVALASARAIEGRVLDAGGLPVEGVGVSLAGGDGDRRRYLPEGMPALDITYGIGLACRTDDLGRFRFPDLCPGDYKVTARTEGSVLALEKPVHLGAEKDVLDLEFRPAAGSNASLTVALVDETGAPAAGLKVRAMVGREMVTKDSGADGRARFDALGTEAVNIEVFEFPFDAPRRYVWPRLDPVVPSGQEVVVRLRRAGEITGVVLAPEGAPLGGMLVTVMEGSGTWTTGSYAKEDGTFRLAVALGDTVDVDVPGQRHQGGKQESTPFRGRRKGVVSPTEGLEIRTAAVDMDRRLTIRVVDLEGRPLKGFALSLLKPGEKSYPLTDEKGEYAAEGLAADEVMVSVMPPGVRLGEPSPVPDGAVLPAPVKVVPEGQVVVMPLRKGVPFTGLVLDGEGRPAGKAHVMIQTADYSVANGTTDAAGRFRVWIPPDQKLMMAYGMLRGADGGNWVKQLQGPDLEKAAEKGELEIRLEPMKGR